MINTEQTPPMKMRPANEYKTISEPFSTERHSGVAANVRITAMILPAPNMSPTTISEGIGYVVSAAIDKPAGIIGTSPPPLTAVSRSINGILPETKLQPVKAPPIKAITQMTLNVVRYFFVLSRMKPMRKAHSTPNTMKTNPNSEMKAGLKP